jgi:phosphoenolpyruvate synthase/pyruvate phosphate dikinase
MNNSYSVDIIAGTGKEEIGNICIPDRGDEVTENSIIVIPHGGQKYHIEGLKCKAIITEIGNRLCHLAIVTREQGKLLVRMDNAMEQLKNAKQIWLRCKGDKPTAITIGE